MNVSEAELPVLVRLIDAGEEPLSLLLLGKMEEYLDDLRAVKVEVPLHIHDGAVALLPHVFLVAQLFRKSLVAENLGMYSNHQHFFVIGTIENADPPPFGKPAVERQRKSCCSSSALGCLKLNTSQPSD